jgi:hypothetical protein
MPTAHASPAPKSRPGCPCTSCLPLRPRQRRWWLQPENSPGQLRRRVNRDPAKRLAKPVSNANLALISATSLCPRSFNWPSNWRMVPADFVAKIWMFAFRKMRIANGARIRADLKPPPTPPQVCQTPQRARDCKSPGATCPQAAEASPVVSSLLSIGRQSVGPWIAAI